MAFRRNLRLFFQTRGLLPLILCGILSGEVFRCIGVFYNQLQYVRCGMGERAIALVYMAETLAMLLGALSAALTRRLGERRTGFLLLGVLAACCAMLAATKNAALSVAAMLAMSAASALYGPLGSTLENRLVATEERATALSVNALVYDGVAIPLNLLLGHLAEASLPGMFLVCAAACAGALGLFGRAASSFTAPGESPSSRRA